IHNLNLLTNTVGRHDGDLARLIDSSNAAIGAIAKQDPNVQRAVQELPGTLKTAHGTFNDLTKFGAQLGPTFNDLRPFARNLSAVNASVRSLARSATPEIRTQIRPFVRSARKPVPDLKVAAQRYVKATPSLTTVGKKVNRLGNMAAYNPNGAQPPGTGNRDEGYLYWAGWLSHNADRIVSAQAGPGLDRRIYVTAR